MRRPRLDGGNAAAAWSGLCGKRPRPVTAALLQLLAFPALRDNLIWALVDADGGAVVVDPGAFPPLTAALDAGLRPTAILLTHHHADHVDGALALAERSGAPLFGPADVRLPAAVRPLSAGTHRLPGGWAVEVLAVPGHTRSHLAFHVAGHLFCGDTLFSLGCGRLFEGSPAQMLDALDRLSALPEATAVCCGHEYTLANARFAAVVEPDNPAREAWVAEARRRLAAGRPSLPSRIGIERAANPFLRVDVPAIRHRLAEARHAADDRLAAFAALRAWKDGFA